MSFHIKYGQEKVERSELKKKGYSVTRGGKREKKDHCYDYRR